MKINVKRLDSTIAKLQELRRLATDPALSDFIEVTGVKSTSNGSTSNAESSGQANGHGALRTAVLAACKALMGSTFKIKQVYQMMGTLGSADTGTEKSVSNMLRLLANENELRIALRGQGRRPTTYSNI